MKSCSYKYAFVKNSVENWFCIFSQISFYKPNTFKTLFLADATFFSQDWGSMTDREKDACLTCNSQGNQNV